MATVYCLERGSLGRGRRMCHIKRLGPKVRRQEFVPGLCPLLTERCETHHTYSACLVGGVEEVTRLEVVVQIKL